MWEVEFTDNFGRWWDSLTEDEQDAVAAGVELIRRFVAGAAPSVFRHDQGIEAHQHEGASDPVPRQTHSDDVCI